MLTVVAVIAAVTGGLIWYGNRHNFFDLQIYVRAINWWADGHQLYTYAQADEVQGWLYFTYPPLSALLMWPAAFVPLWLSVIVFTIASFAALFVTTWWLIRAQVRRRGWPAWYALGVTVPPLLWLEPIRETVTFGQINLFLIFLILADLLVGLPRRARWTGVGIGLATALKLYPGIFVVHLLVTRRWREAATAAGTATVATLLVAAIAPSASWAFWTGALWSTERVGRIDHTANQSLLGAMTRLSAPESPNRVLWIGLVTLVLGYGLWRADQLHRAGAGVAALTVTGLVGSLISPITWNHHIYWFVPAIMVLLTAGGPWRYVAGAVFVVITAGVESFHNWGPTLRIGDPWFVQAFRSLYLPVMIGLVIALPGGRALPFRGVRAAPGRRVPSNSDEESALA